MIMDSFRGYFESISEVELSDLASLLLWLATKREVVRADLRANYASGLAKAQQMK